MEPPADAWLRWTRAAVLATVALLVAVWAHVGADGRLPSAPGLLLVVAGLTVAAQPLLARPASRVRVVLLTVGGQSLAHAALSLGAGHRAAPAAAGPHHHPAEAHLAAPGRIAAAGAEWDVVRRVLDAPAHLLDDLASAGAPMLLSHLGAAVLVGAWLAAGERALWAVLALLGRVLVLRVPRASSVVPPRTDASGAPGRTVVAPRRRLVAGAVVRRGPPALLAA